VTKELRGEVKVDGVPIERKLGYDHAVEMAEIAGRYRRQGLDGVELHFASIRHYENRHRDDPTYKERQAKWLATQVAATPIDLLRVALEEIRDGHNDPRALAREVLEGIT
jgi:hypothetical protein